MKLLIMICTVCAMLGSAYANDEVSVMDPRVIIEGNISRSEAKFIYTSRVRYWPNGERIVVFHYPPGNKIYQDFVRDILGYNPSEFTRTLDYQRNAGTLQSLHVVRTESQMLAKVGDTPGSIGYISNGFYINNGVGYVKKLNIID